MVFEEAEGNLKYEKARVPWFLSIDASDLPVEVKIRQTTFRSLSCGVQEAQLLPAELVRACYPSASTGKNRPGMAHN